MVDSNTPQPLVQKSIVVGYVFFFQAQSTKALVSNEVDTSFALGIEIISQVRNLFSFVLTAFTAEGKEQGGK